MLLVDDILLFPITGFFWVFREIHKAAQQEIVSEKEAVTAELSDLYMMLETGKITEEEFDAREQVLLNRLDQLQGESPETPETVDESDPDESEQWSRE
jgi:Gas vesicle protein G